MEFISQALLAWLITTVSIFVMSKLPLGIYVKDFGTAVVAGLIIGLLNTFLRPVLGFFSIPFMILTLGLFSFVLNAFLFWLATVLVKGFELRGCLAAFVGPLVLWLLTSLLYAIF